MVGRTIRAHIMLDKFNDTIMEQTIPSSFHVLNWQWHTKAQVHGCNEIEHAMFAL